MASTTQVLHSKLSSSSSERPIFSRQRVHHAPPHPVTHAAASNLQIVLVLANRTLQRIDQSGRAQQAATIETVDFGKACPPGAKVTRVFLDPRGSHLLLAVRPADPEGGGQAELLYLNRRSPRVRSVAKLKGQQVTRMLLTLIPRNHL